MNYYIECIFLIFFEMIYQVLKIIVKSIISIMVYNVNLYVVEVFDINVHK